MRFLRPLGRFCAVSVCAGAWFAWLIPWSGWNDPDAYYHATTSLLTWQHGVIRAFPWLDLTLLGTSYADLHVGFHVIVAPFTALFGDLLGLRIASVLLAALCVAVFDACLRNLRIRSAGVWTLVLATSYPFVFRVLLGKATPLALILFFVGLTAAWKRRPIVVALLTCVFALSHGGWIYLAGSVTLLAFGDLLFDLIVLDTSRRQAIATSRWREVLAAWAGGIAGLFLHPNGTAVFTFAWAQVVTIGIGTPMNRVLMGNEWLPSDVSGMLTTFAIPVILLIVGGVGLIFARRAPLEIDLARLLVSLGLIVAVLVGLTFKSRRNAEYLMPVLVWWCAALWSLVDPVALRAWFAEAIPSRMPRLRSALSMSLIVVCALVIGKQMFELSTDLHPPNYPDQVYATSMQEISARAVPNDRVFHASWDEFPIIFRLDLRLRYISGLDPTFLFIASSTLSDTVRDVTAHTSTSTADATWALIHDQLDARFVFASRVNNFRFIDRIASDPRYTLIASSTDSAAFMVEAP